MMKAEKGSEIITTICEYENSVAMPDNERLTYLDTCGIARLKDGNGNVKAQEAYANRCSEYLRFGHEVDLAACGAYSPYDALKVCDTPEIFLKTGFEQRPMLYTQKHLFQALTPKSDYNPHRHGFSIEQVKRFPELLASPVVLANSPTREDVLLAILLATDAYDTPLIAGIKPDGTGNYGEREVETNMVLSVYSRQNFIRYFALLRDMDAFVFVSGRKIDALEDLSLESLAVLLSGADARENDEDFKSALDFIFVQIEEGKAYRYVAEYHQYLWVPSTFRRNSDGVKPADRKGLVGSEDFALLCWDSVNHLPAIRRISLKASLTSRLIDFKYLREAEAPAYTHGVPNDTFDYEFDDDDDDIPAFSFPEA